MQIYDRFKFDTFIRDKSNAKAYDACSHFASSDDATAPLLLAGDTGNGKTHLSQAIANDISGRSDFNVAIYAPDELDAILASPHYELDRLMQHLNYIDLFVLEHIQYFVFRTTGRIVLEILENRIGLQRKTLLTVHISALSDEKFLSVYENILGRCERVYLHCPENETRKKIVKECLRKLGKRPPEACIEEIANSAAANVRELEGQCLRVSAVSEFKRCPITLHLIQKVLVKRPVISD